MAGYMFLLLSEIVGDILYTFLSFVIGGYRRETGIVKNREALLIHVFE